VRSTARRSTDDAAGAFDHRAAVYTSVGEMLEVVSPFVREGTHQQERVVLVLSDLPMQAARAELGAVFDRIEAIRAEAMYARPAKMYADYCAMLDAHTRTTTRPLRLVAEQALVGASGHGASVDAAPPTLCRASHTIVRAPERAR
jgi:hypothetical protein